MGIVASVLSNAAVHVANTLAVTCCCAFFDRFVVNPVLRFFRRLMPGCCCASRQNRRVGGTNDGDVELGEAEQQVQQHPENLRRPFEISIKCCDNRIVGSFLSSELFVELDEVNRNKLWQELTEKEEDYNRQRRLLNSKLEELLTEHQKAEDNLREQRDLILRRARNILAKSRYGSSIDKARNTI